MQQATPGERGLDDVFEALSHPTRRQVLAQVKASNPLYVAALVESSRNEGNPRFDAAAIPINHVHLPKLADSGFIEWDREYDVIRKGPRFEEIAPVLELLAAHDDQLPGGWS